MRTINASYNITQFKCARVAQFFMKIFGWGVLEVVLKVTYFVLFGAIFEGVGDMLGGIQTSDIALLLGLL